MHLHGGQRISKDSDFAQLGEASRCCQQIEGELDLADGALGRLEGH